MVGWPDLVRLKLTQLRQELKNGWVWVTFRRVWLKMSRKYTFTGGGGWVAGSSRTKANSVPS